jgi:hypothetical protein
VKQHSPSSWPSISLRVSLSSWSEWPASAASPRISKNCRLYGGERTEEDEMVAGACIPHEQHYLLALLPESACAAGRDGGAYDVFFRRPEPERALVAIQHVRHVFRIPPTMFCAHARVSTGCVRHGGRRAHRSRIDRSCARPPAPRASPTRRRPRRGRRGARWHSQSL